MLAPETRLVGDGEGMPTGPFRRFFSLRSLAARANLDWLTCSGWDQFAPAIVSLSLTLRVLIDTQMRGFFCDWRLRYS